MRHCTDQQTVWKQTLKKIGLILIIFLLILLPISLLFDDFINDVQWLWSTITCKKSEHPDYQPSLRTLSKLANDDIRRPLFDLGFSTGGFFALCSPVLVTSTPSSSLIYLKNHFMAL